MINDLLYRCPQCGAFDWLEQNHCVSCHVDFRLTTRSLASLDGEVRPISHWYKKVQAFELPQAFSGFIMKSRQVRLSRESQEGMYKGYSGITAYHFTRAPVDTGTLFLKEGVLSFSGVTNSIDVPFAALMGVTIESNTVIVISREHGPLFFDFLHESGKKWEDLIQKALKKHHEQSEIVEFYPRVRFKGSFREKASNAPGHQRLHVPERRWSPREKSMLSLVLKPIARPILKALFSVTITGLENIPAKGAAIVMPNHTSFLDSVILGFLTRRDIWFMAKNSEYRHYLMNWFLRHAGSFPVRRYTIDMLAVRNAIRVVQHGHILGIFPEGERTWDGEMLPLHTGTIRLILALDTPVIPVGISGAYSLMPRWTSSIKRSPVKMAIGKPMKFAHIPIPRQTRDDIQTASGELCTQIQRLTGGGL
jgi:1-acyl-sn-glycerol-3-phosphate acyltransferase